MNNLTAPIVLLEIERKRLSRDLTDRLLSFVYEDHEAELDLLEVSLADPYLQFIDDPLLQEGNEIRARFGYADELSPTKTAVIKEIGYDFPDGGAPTITIKAYDKGCRLSAQQVLRVWEKAGGIRASEIAAAIAKEHGLTPVVTTTVDRFPRLHQSKVSDAQFLRRLAKTARASKGKGATGYLFYVEGEELHFHPRGLEKPPVMALEYFSGRSGILRSFRPQTQTMGEAAGGISTAAVGVDAKGKRALSTVAADATTPERVTLGKRSALAGGAGTAGRAGQITAAAGSADQRPAAEAGFVSGELRQVSAEALTIGLPALRAKTNIELRGVGRKFSGLYHLEAVRHRIDGGGYGCELTLRRNALGGGAGAKATATRGTANTSRSKGTTNGRTGRPAPQSRARAEKRIIIDADSGRRRE